MTRKKLLLASLVLALTGTAATLAPLQFSPGLQFPPAGGNSSARTPGNLPGTHAGLDLSAWPQHCRRLRRHLQHQLSAATVYQQRPVQPFVAPAWKLRWQGTVLAIPAVDYHELTVLRRKSGQLVLALQTSSNSPSAEDTVKLVFSQMPPTQEQEPVETFQVAALEGVAEQAGRGRRRLNPNGSLQQLLARRLLARRLGHQPTSGAISGTTSGAIARDDVLEFAYHHGVEDLSCDRAQWEEDLPIALALKLKLETAQASDPGVVAVYPRVGSLAGRVLRRRSENRSENYVLGRDRTSPSASPRPTPRTEWQIQLADPSQTALWISLPEHHASADVGLGTGQDNWWEAPQRPLWLDALEAAIASDSPTIWRQLETHLAASQLSENSVRSVQQIITTLDALPPHDSRLPNARLPAATDLKTARE